MKIHVLAAPRSGATAYSLELAKRNNLQFFNEPFQFAFYFNKVKSGPIEFGGGMPPEATDYVSHHITSQYLMNVGVTNIPHDHQIILIERRDKWSQLKSYIAGVELYKKYKGWHNLNYSTEHIEAKEVSIQRMIHEWIMFDFFSNTHPNITVQYYEDLDLLDTADIKKNTGNSELVFLNQEKIYRYYLEYMKSRPNLPISPMN